VVTVWTHTTAGWNCGQAGYLKAISPSHEEADNFPVLLGVMKTRLFECSIECGSYQLCSSITMKRYPRRHGPDFLSTCQVLPAGGVLHLELTCSLGMAYHCNCDHKLRSWVLNEMAFCGTDSAMGSIVIRTDCSTTIPFSLRSDDRCNTTVLVPLQV
jgi:hypothetical protein